MRGDIIYQIFGVHEGRVDDSYFGAFRTQAAAQGEMAKLSARLMHGQNWAMRYHNLGFVIREKVVDTDFEIPALPMPRHKYFVQCTAKSHSTGAWDSTRVQVSRRLISADEPQAICEFERSHAMFQTFEPFRQAQREFALISMDYTRAAVLDLASGKVIAEEPETDPPGNGFCPVGFYVPDWWDLHDESILPGSVFWTDDDAWPIGDFGFVWGCYWGDDSSWQLQYLDLSRVRDGVIGRDERFGRVELATRGYESPCFAANLDSIKQSAPPFIQISRAGGLVRVRFDVEIDFDLASGKPKQWQRSTLLNDE